MFEEKSGGTGSEAGGEEDAALELELGEEGGEKEDLYGADGKPLPWNQSKRFRKLYGEAKEGRKLQSTLKEMGLKTSDLPILRAEMARLGKYDEAYANWQAQQKKGETDDDDDAEAREVQKRIKALKSQLKSLGVKMVEDEEEDQEKSRAKSVEARKDEVIGRARERITELLEDAGVDFEKMDKADARDLLDEFDLKLGQKIMRDEDAKAAFMRGSLRPIEKYFKEVAAKAALPLKKSAPKGTGISQLPPRMLGSGSQSTTRRDDKSGPPKSVKDATADVLADLKARNAARRAEE